jgi:ferredoxin
MRVVIDPKRCQGHGMCNMVCPQVFRYDDEGFGYVVPEHETVPTALEDEVRLAEIQCPERAIVITESA